MKYLIIMLLFVTNCYAVEFEILAGHSVYATSNNGIWYQTGKGLDYHFERDANSVGFGLTDYIAPDVRWHAGYMNLGETTSWAIATPDADYTGSGCVKSPCDKYDVYMGKGSVEGFYFTVSPEYTYNDFKFFVEGGLWAFLAKFNATVIGPRTQTYNQVFFNMNKKEDWQLGLVVGFGVEYRKTQFLVSAWRVDSVNDWDVMIPNYQGYTTNFSIRHIF